MNSITSITKEEEEEAAYVESQELEVTLDLIWANFSMNFICFIQMRNLEIEKLSQVKGEIIQI